MSPTRLKSQNKALKNREAKIKIFEICFFFQVKTTLQGVKLDTHFYSTLK